LAAIGVFAAIVVVVGIAMARTGLPWDEMFGHVVSKGRTENLFVMGRNLTLKCKGGGNLTTNGNDNTFTIIGHCDSLGVFGDNNHVTVDTADSIQVNGIDNVITYHSGTPQIANRGLDNSVRQG
jgi:hypothetical protein